MAFEIAIILKRANGARAAADIWGLFQRTARPATSGCEYQHAQAGRYARVSSSRADVLQKSHS